MQRLRGSVYLEDRAINRSQLKGDGRHVSEWDDRSWHLLTMGPGGKVLGCLRFLRHANTVESWELGISQGSLASCDVRGPIFRASLNAELKMAREAGFPYIEVGGWALAREARGTAQALNSVLATYAWAELQGGAIGISAATERNGSASILRRLGGESLQWAGKAIRPYYDHAYGCVMEILRFDSRHPSRKYASAIRDFCSVIATLPVVMPSEA
ncbi:MAG TPA: hypothetical protein VG273_06015 [Bryobacteraceae bacterium]|nr:hypothetical protein [Bryobacteraceae bacterium]